MVEGNLNNLGYNGMIDPVKPNIQLSNQQEPPFNQVHRTLTVIDVFIRTNKTIDFSFQSSMLKLLSQLKHELLETQLNLEQVV